jgi:hypothetical protein
MGALVMAKKKAAKKATSKSSGSKGTKKASRKGTKKKSAKKSRTMLGRMSDMMESAGEGISSAAKYVAPKGMLGGRKKKKGGKK